MSRALHSLTAAEAREGLSAGDFSAMDLLEACVSRIEAVNPIVNAVVTTCYERARQEAEVWSKRIAAGQDVPPIAGIPVLIKDNQRTEGVRTTLGSPLHQNNIPDTDAGIVARLRHAGAIVLGKTNIPEYSIGANTVNPLFGATGNPFDPSLTCGGSSGGSAVGVASSMAPLATGSDHGGSLRIPASFCGVVGYRASPGVVPNEEGATPSTHYSLQGPICRTVADAALMLSVIAGRTHGADRDPMAYPLDTLRFRELSVPALERLKVAVSPDLGGVLVSQENRALFEERVSHFGHLFARCDWHSIDLTEAPEVDWHLRQDVFVSQYFDQAGDWPEDINPNLTATYDAAVQTSMVDIAVARRRQLALIRRCNELFRDYDLLIVPGVSVPPFPWTDAYPAEIDGHPVENYMAWLALTSSLTVTGQPVVALPCGLDRQGTPFGLQVVGPMYQDHGLLSAAHAIEQQFQTDEVLRRPVPNLEQ